MMIKEITTVIRVGADCLWVEAVQQSACGSCKARSGCGQAVLAGLSGRTAQIRALLEDSDETRYQVGQEVEIGIPDDVVVKGSLFIYFLPLLGLLLGAGIVDSWLENELLTVVAAGAGLLLGGLLVRMVSLLMSNEARLQPTVIPGALSLVTHL